MAEEDPAVKSLQEHKDLLYKVEKLLSVDPSNADNIKIKSDLLQVIALTEDLLQMKYGFVPKPLKTASEERAAGLTLISNIYCTPF